MASTNFEFLKFIILIFHVKYLKYVLGELDVWVVACNFEVFGILSFISDFIRSNLFIFEPKVEENVRVFFPPYFSYNLNYGTKHNGRMI